MAVQDALEKRVAELRKVEEQRKRDKVAAFRADYSADEVSLDTVNGAEVVILDRQYMLVETHQKRENHKSSHASGPGQGSYTPGFRTLVGATVRNGTARLVGMVVNDLDEMAALALLKGTEFEALTGNLEACVGISDETFWYNLLGS